MKSDRGAGGDQGETVDQGETDLEPVLELVLEGPAAVLERRRSSSSSSSRAG